MSKSIRILIADDHTIVRQGLARLLEEQPDLKVVAESTNGQVAYEQALVLKPDIVILDIAMPRMNGIEAAVDYQSLEVKRVVIDDPDIVIEELNGQTNFSIMLAELESKGSQPASEPSTESGGEPEPEACEGVAAGVEGDLALSRKNLCVGSQTPAHRQENETTNH